MRHLKSILRDGYLILSGIVLICSVPLLTIAQSLDSEFGEGTLLYSSGMNKPTDVFQVDWDQDWDRDVLGFAKGQKNFFIFDNQGEQEFEEYRYLGKSNTGIQNLIPVDKRPDSSLVIWASSEHSIHQFVKKKDSIVHQTVVTRASYNINNLDVIDVDRDGDKDPVFLSSDSRDENFEFDLKWIENIDEGEYGGIQSLPGSAYGKATVMSADLNQNGFKDILIASDNRLNEAITVSHVSYDQQSETHEVSEIVESEFVENHFADLEDLDGDGDRDLLLAGSKTMESNKLKVYLNEEGSFDSVKTLLSTGVNETYRSFDDIAISDFDGDSDKELVIKWTFTDGVDGMAYADQAPGLAFEASSLPDSYVRRWNRMQEFKGNSEGGSCLLLSSTQENSIALGCYDYESGEWEGSLNYMHDPLATPIKDFRSINSNGGSSDQVVIGSPYGYRERLSLLRPQEDSEAKTNTSLITEMEILSDVKVADLNGNGFEDLIFEIANPIPYSQHVGKVGVILNEEGSFGDPIYLTGDDHSLSKYHDIYLADLDRNGYKDIILRTSDVKDDVAPPRKDLIGYRNNGNGDFGEADTLLADYGGILKRVTDINEDDYPDLIFSKDFGKEVLIAENNQDFSFDSVEVATTFEKKGTIRFADLNSDEEVELIRGLNDGSEAAIYQRNASGEWTEEVSGFGLSSFYQLRLVDLNQDSYLDAVYFSEDNDSLLWRENKTGIDYGEARVVDSGLPSDAAMQTAHIDGNGKPDILVAKHRNQITWYRNKTIASVSGGQRPDKFNVYSNYPNPFNPVTHIRYQLPEDAKVTITVYDIAGRQVARLVDRRQSAGKHTIRFNAEHLGSGVYFYRIKAGEQYRGTQKMTLIK